MNDIVSASQTGLRPVPRRDDVRVRLATPDDIPFMDGLQKKHTKELGYFPTKQFVVYVETGGVLVAETNGERAGYVISRDRYLKRDELGVVYQMCVVPEYRRTLVAAVLLKTTFERSAYGCRLYCCWCAQDLAANRFWASMGFVPIAFRGGGGATRGQKRVHIFWQRRIVAGDDVTPWWFPSKTDGGAMRGDRIVLPIPPGLRWDDPMPVLKGASPEEPEKVRRPRKTKTKPDPSAGPLEPTVVRAVAKFGPPGDDVAEEVAPPTPVTAEIELARPKTRVAKVDPVWVATARELRDRYLEEVRMDPSLIAPAAGSYDVSRLLGFDDATRRGMLPDEGDGDHGQPRELAA